MLLLQSNSFSCLRSPSAEPSLFPQLCAQHEAGQRRCTAADWRIAAAATAVDHASVGLQWAPVELRCCVLALVVVVRLSSGGGGLTVCERGTRKTNKANESESDK